MLDIDNRSHNMLLTRPRYLGERAAAMLLTRRKTQNRITQCPWRIGDIAKAALVLTQLEHPGRYRENLSEYTAKFGNLRNGRSVQEPNAPARCSCPKPQLRGQHAVAGPEEDHDRGRVECAARRSPRCL
ncbi:hypothetical protein [Lentzea tibetensis]|uniref:hypothetical protein n=1 Tax=Lentzea tibetensis TaxID=2591470 RepID=UPI001C99D5E9